MSEVLQSSQGAEFIKLKSSDEQVFEVKRKVAFMSETVRSLVSEVESQSAAEIIPLDNVKGQVLAKVLEYCKHQQEEEETAPDFLDDDGVGGKDDDEADEDDGEVDGEKRDKKANSLDAFQQDFVNVDQPELFDLMLAANYLAVQELLDFLIKHVAGMIVACKDAAEIREKFSIPNDLTPEEVEAIKRRHSWAFE